MSPATLRRYRAQRLLERDFQSLRGSVLATVAARLRAAGTPLGEAELDACYAVAWQGLYASALAGEEIANPRAWLVLVTYRRAIEELRLLRSGERPLPEAASVEPDLDGDLDDRERLRSLLQGMRARLDLREREAAALCYLHGFSRGEAARLMGLSDNRMRKLMEGSKGRVGVAAKVGEIAQTIAHGSFCEQQASLMRALAFGMLDPDGERYRLALQHRRDCPACRRYVATLRGIAVVLPPVLTLPGHGARAIAGVAGLHHQAAAGPAPAPLSSLGASAATGGGGAAAGGGWLLGGAGLGAKLAAGCLLAVGLGAGCVAVEGGGVSHLSRKEPTRHTLAARTIARARVSTAAPVVKPVASQAPETRDVARSAAVRGREFTLEQPVASRRTRTSEPVVRATVASVAATRLRATAPAGDAAREFSPG
jgi:DNA-directed RNA polymerase specialized sigma24 family protein